MYLIDYFCFVMSSPFLISIFLISRFFFWMKHIRTTKSSGAQNTLTDQLFILNPYLRQPLIALRTECVEAGKWPVGKWDGKTTYTLEKFVEAQEVQRQKTEGLLQGLNERVHSIVINACQKDLHQFLVKNGFRRADGSSVHHDPRSDDVCFVCFFRCFRSPIPCIDFLVSTESVSVSQMDEESKTSHAERAAHRTECRKLTKYIRLSDQMVLDSLVTMSLERATEMLKYGPPD
jgi:hypothetical protein